jgi:hypothetical protein
MARSLIGACGMLCSTCAIFIATASLDRAKMAELAEELSKESRKKLGTSDINCWGCRCSDKHCFNANCRFRKCSKNKGLEFCYRCAQYPCDNIQAFYKKQPSAQENLKRICKIGVDAFNSELADQESENE